jgi:hypothetical protein
MILSHRVKKAAHTDTEHAERRRCSHAAATAAAKPSQIPATFSADSTPDALFFKSHDIARLVDWFNAHRMQTVPRDLSGPQPSME